MCSALSADIDIESSRKSCAFPPGMSPSVWTREAAVSKDITFAKSNGISRTCRGRSENESGSNIGTSSSDYFLAQHFRCVRIEDAEGEARWPTSGGAPGTGRALITRNSEVSDDG